MESVVESKRFRILSLDGGGSKGLYTLGVLREIEAAIGSPLHEKFDLVYGTSTGSIIATGIASGMSIQEIIDFYLRDVSGILGAFTASGRSNSLNATLKETFKDLNYESLKTDIGIVATNLDDKKPFIFKSSIKYAHGRKATFIPGFGAPIYDAVTASCSAYPFFVVKDVHTKNQETVRAIDGGFCANNPALFALADALFAFEVKEDDVDVLSVGVGNYPEKYPWRVALQGWRLKPALDLISAQFSSNSNTMEILFNISSKRASSVRVNETFSEPEITTSLFETNKNILKRLIVKGRESYGKQEKEILDLLK